jgi:hypothetical protein
MGQVDKLIFACFFFLIQSQYTSTIRRVVEYNRQKCGFEIYGAKGEDLFCIYNR